MKKTLLITLTLLISGFAFAQGSGEVIITEIHNRPQKPTQAQLDAAILAGGVTSDTTPNEGHTEWFEVYNTTESAVVMDGWQIIDASSSSNITTIGTFTLAANSYAAFAGFQIPDAQGGVVFDYIYDYKKPSFNNESTYSSGSTTNCPDGVILKNGNGDLVDQVIYDYGYGSYIVGGVSNCSTNTGSTAFGFPGQNGNSKTSFMLKVTAPKTAAGNDDASNWEYSTITYDSVNGQLGTPGLSNDGATASVREDFLTNFSLYPNPSNGFINIQSKNVEISKVQLFTITGQKVLDQKGLVNGGIDVSTYSKGIYILKIESGDKFYTNKIIVE